MNKISVILLGSILLLSLSHPSLVQSQQEQFELVPQDDIHVNLIMNGTSRNIEVSFELDEAIRLSLDRIAFLISGIHGEYITNLVFSANSEANLTTSISIEDFWPRLVHVYRLFLHFSGGTVELFLEENDFTTDQVDVLTDNNNLNAPELPQIENISVSDSSISTSDTTIIYANISNTRSLNLPIYAKFYGVTSNKFETSVSMNYNSNLNLFSGLLDNLDIYSDSQIYIQSIRIPDRYTHDIILENSTDFVSPVITLTDATPDFEPPELHSLVFNQTAVSLGETVLASANITDNLSGFDRLFIKLGKSKPLIALENWIYNSNNELWETTFTLTDSRIPGPLEVVGIDLFDAADNRIIEASFNLENFPQITVNNPNADDQLPTIIESVYNDTSLFDSLANIEITLEDNYEVLRQVIYFYDLLDQEGNIVASGYGSVFDPDMSYSKNYTDILQIFHIRENFGVWAEQVRLSTIAIHDRYHVIAYSVEPIDDVDYVLVDDLPIIDIVYPEHWYQRVEIEDDDGNDSDKSQSFIELVPVFTGIMIAVFSKIRNRDKNNVSQ